MKQTDPLQHGTIKQHLHYLRRRHTALSLLEPSTAPTQPTLALIDTGALTEIVKPKRMPKPAKEFKVIALRECPLPYSLRVMDTPENIVTYYSLFIPNSLTFRPCSENMIVIFLTTRRHCLGHEIISNGSLDTILVHSRDVFRTAIDRNAAAIVLMHNHPSGDPTPSEADIKTTRDLIRAGQLLKIEVLDHIIKGVATPDRPKDYASLRELGYFYT
jgi:hypothetical protein